MGLGQPGASSRRGEESDWNLMRSMCAYTEGSLSVYRGRYIPYSHFVCLCVCPSYSKLHFFIF